MPEFYAKEFYIENFRKIKDRKMKIGKKITVFSGQNGVGKSNVMSLIASTFGTKERRRTGGTFQPEFDDFFTITNDEEYLTYKSYLKICVEGSNEFLEKEQSCKSDNSGSRGVRIIPRQSKYYSQDSISKKELGRIVKDKYGIGPDARIPTPSIYLSLSRLYPVGETVVTKHNIRGNNNLLTFQADEKFIEWYEEILPNSLNKSGDSSISLIQKEINRSKQTIYGNLKDASPETQSVGQDNIGQIISALVDFYVLKQLSDNYKGGILCIDEIDASLHPDIQIKMFRLLKQLSNELDLQIFITTHSLTILKEIVRARNRNDEDFVLNYFIDLEMPRINDDWKYEDIKANLFNQVSTFDPEVKIYCEDELTEFIFREIIAVYQRTKSEQLPKNNILPVHLGCEQLKKLPKIDSHFQNVLIVIDGDAKIDNKSGFLYKYIYNEIDETTFTLKEFANNIVSLPTFLAPESYLYYICHKISNDKEGYRDFWDGLDNNPEAKLYSVSWLQEQLTKLTVTSSTKNDDIKKCGELVNNLKEFVQKSQIINYLSKRENDDFSLEYTYEKIHDKMKMLYSKLKSDTL